MPTEKPPGEAHPEEQLARARELFEQTRRETELERAKKIFEEAHQQTPTAEPEPSGHDIRTGDPKKLKRLQQRMEKIYPVGHEVPKNVGKPFKIVEKEDRKP